MMTPSNSVGYGICGHKNRYSAKVKDGNWVEDKIAVERLSKYVRPSTTYVSEYTSRFADKSNAIGDVSSSLLEVQHLKAKNKEGLPYKLIFQHGDDANPEEIYQSTLQRSSSVEQFKIPNGTLRSKKEEEHRKEIDDIRTMTTITRQSYNRSRVNPEATPIALHDTAELPRWNRRSHKFLLNNM